MPRARTCFAIALSLLAAAAAPVARAQCILANPSFEMLGSGGQVFSGWYQFGSFGVSSQAVHGHLAARVSGPDTGALGVSGYFQDQDAAPGQRWAASVFGWHTASHPLTGGSRAILNIEWRDAGGGLISYESHMVADASTPVGQIQSVAVTSAPAPLGTAKTRLLLAVVQEPGDPLPNAYFDQATFESLGPPTLDELQWADFPGGRTLEFGGRTWRVKGPGTYGPGPNPFCDTAGCAWVDAQDRLHLTIQKIGSTWYSTEVTLEDALGYGDYVFTTLGRVDALDPSAVLGLFLWQYGPCYASSYLWWNPYNEIDVEISRWGSPGNTPAQFVAQPYDYEGNLDRFDVVLGEGELSSYAFRWLPDRVEFRSWRGGPDDESPASLIHAWTYTGPHIPRPEQPRVHMNLWRLNTSLAVYQEAVIAGFRFAPACANPPCIVGVPVVPPAAGTAVRLSAARPNPFHARSAITYTLARASQVEVGVYDVAGRRVRTLVRRSVGAGSHEVVWDGLDDAGARVPSGVYLCRVRVDGAVGSRPMILLR